MSRGGRLAFEPFPICLGCNVFGWTADRDQSFQVLDAFTAAGGNLIDTADSYMFMYEGNEGGQSERIIGEWFAADPGNRAKVKLATKVGRLPERLGLSAANIAAACDDSLERLQTDHIDLYYAHIDDPETPLEETLEAFAALIEAGKVRQVAASNYSAERLAEALAVSGRLGVPGFVALQPHYNLLKRDQYEGELERVCAENGIVCLPYWALAMGYLTGKYRSSEPVQSVRAGRAASTYDDDRGRAVLAVMDDISAARGGVPLGAIALAWLIAKPTVAAPIASARNLEQLEQMLPAATLGLTADEVARLDAAGQLAPA